MNCTINKQTNDGELPVEASMMFLGCFVSQTAFLKKGCTHPTLQFFHDPKFRFLIEILSRNLNHFTKCRDRISAVTSPTFHHGGGTCLKGFSASLSNNIFPSCWEFFDHFRRWICGLCELVSPPNIENKKHVGMQFSPLPGSIVAGED